MMLSGDTRCHWLTCWALYRVVPPLELVTGNWNLSGDWYLKLPDSWPGRKTRSLSNTVSLWLRTEEHRAKTNATTDIRQFEKHMYWHYIALPQQQQKNEKTTWQPHQNFILWTAYIFSYMEATMLVEKLREDSLLGTHETSAISDSAEMYSSTQRQ